MRWDVILPAQEKYNPHSFKTSKAFRNRLLAWNIMKEWDTVFGAQTDFTHADFPAKQEQVLYVMNHFAVMLENRFTGWSVEELGVVLIQL